MEVGDTLGNSLQHGTCFSLREKLLAENFVQQFTTSHPLRHQVNFITIVIYLKQEDGQNEK
jgi:hypothetical protein